MKKMKPLSEVPIALVGATLISLMIALFPFSHAGATPIYATGIINNTWSLMTIDRTSYSSRDCLLPNKRIIFILSRESVMG